MTQDISVVESNPENKEDLKSIKSNTINYPTVDKMGIISPQSEINFESVQNNKRDSSLHRKFNYFLKHHVGKSKNCNIEKPANPISVEDIQSATKANIGAAKHENEIRASLTRLQDVKEFFIKDGKPNLNCAAGQISPCIIKDQENRFSFVSTEHENNPIRYRITNATSTEDVSSVSSLSSPSLEQVTIEKQPVLVDVESANGTPKNPGIDGQLLFYISNNMERRMALINQYLKQSKILEQKEKELRDKQHQLLRKADQLKSHCLIEENFDVFISNDKKEEIINIYVGEDNENERKKTVDPMINSLTDKIEKSKSTFIENHTHKTKTDEHLNSSVGKYYPVYDCGKIGQHCIKPLIISKSQLQIINENENLLDQNKMLSEQLENIQVVDNISSNKLLSDLIKNTRLVGSLSKQLCEEKKKRMVAEELCLFHSNGIDPEVKDLVFTVSELKNKLTAQGT